MLLGKAKATHTTFLPPASEEPALWLQGAGGQRHCPRGKEEGGMGGAADSFPELRGLLPQWSVTVCCVQAGLGCWPHLAGVCAIHTHPFAQMSKQRLRDGQRLTTWATHWGSGEQGG